jgi:hypothetical protein
MRVIVLLLCCCMFVLPLAAAEQDPYEHLAKVKSLRCQFAEGMSGDWKNGILEVKKDHFEDNLHFDSIDLKAGQARFIGNIGSNNVTVITTRESVTFVERTSSGNFIFTSVFPEYKKGTREFIAVTSRHIMLWDGPLPSQYHGTCQVWE